MWLQLLHCPGAIRLENRPQVSVVFVWSADCFSMFENTSNFLVPWKWQVVIGKKNKRGLAYQKGNCFIVNKFHVEAKTDYHLILTSASPPWRHASVKTSTQTVNWGNKSQTHFVYNKMVHVWSILAFIHYYFKHTLLCLTTTGQAREVSGRKRCKTNGGARGSSWVV